MPVTESTVPVLNLVASTVDLTRQLCDIESVSGDERLIADAIVAALAGFDHLDIVREGDAVVARTTLGRDKRVVIAGHIDTVPINHNLPVHEENGYLVGRGTVDMKGGVAIAL
ncbi:M20/M25/M40 family metallo-hydrolase, partial [Salinibacterium sp.]|uniref:M20/M25/M40 family metallo-hydrolase n=1 Tax=Salinibacterium sp. TaxID=1915057 RepID=UPI00286C33BC